MKNMDISDDSRAHQLEKVNMTLLENEVKLDSWTDSVLLTNIRIMQEHGNSYRISIFLEKISSIQMYRKNKPVLLLLGIFFVIVGIILFVAANFVREIYYEIGVSGITMPLFLGIFFIVAFFWTRKNAITVSSDGGKDLNIKINSKISGERIDEFVTNIQSAKLKRMTP